MNIAGDVAVDELGVNLHVRGLAGWVEIVLREFAEL
jgi:hypothetical protein